MKEKLKVSNKREKTKILTLTPESWSLRKTAKEFEVSKATAQKARILREGHFSCTTVYYTKETN